ncbi:MULTISPECIES: hypothetical protein [Hymenobacter]|uniref:Uncharacterized protein n=1 Tax=Hymenobacter mucosus TaxID=1411120 RepID=A0A239B9C0_9BACT|nr:MULTISPECIES: hypothetical protein [Hymenobacter]MDF7815565.1 hypothetical protein [Hymenobacter sp. YC55]SNS04299.1 hypothetical protein SAMN06269173_1203 [Hymenobacter mucosus]
MTTTQFKFGVIRKEHLFTDLQGHNLLAALFFLVLSLVVHSLPAYALFMGFGGVWMAGIFANREVFYFLNTVLVLTTCFLVCQMPVQ